MFNSTLTLINNLNHKIVLLNVELDLCTLYKISILKLISKVGRIEHYITGIKFEKKSANYKKLFQTINKYTIKYCIHSTWIQANAYENLALLSKTNIGMNKKYLRNRFKVLLPFIWVYKTCTILVKPN